MRIAIVAPRDPVPVYTGLLERLYQLSRFLGERHTVCVYFPYERHRKRDEEGRQPDHQPFQRIGLKNRLVEFVGKHVPTYSALRGIYHLHPWLYRSLRRRLIRFDPEAVIVEMPFLVPVSLAATRGLDCRTILSEHNVEYRLAERLDIPLASALRLFEIQVAKQVDTVATVSADDCKALQRDLSKTDLVVAPNGVDVDRYQPRSNDEEALQRVRNQYRLESPLFIYHGNLGNAQNSEAIMELVNEVFPRVREMMPSASLLLIGANQPVIDQPGVICTGLVEDLPTHIAAADVALIPLRSGSGTKLKILEYLASGIPIVTTPVGAEGLPLNDGETAFIASNKEALCEAAVRLARDADLRERVGQNGRRLVTKQFSWNETLAPYESILMGDRTERHITQTDEASSI